MISYSSLMLALNPIPVLRFQIAKNSWTAILALPQWFLSLGHICCHWVACGLLTKSI